LDARLHVLQLGGVVMGWEGGGGHRWRKH
jgi:hypothetical protein